MVGVGIEVGIAFETVGTGLFCEFRTKYAPPPANIIKRITIRIISFPDKKDLEGGGVTGGVG